MNAYKIPCTNCKGHGTISHYKHVENGICFQCYGSGQQDATEEEYKECLKEQAEKKKSSYILFNKGNIEYYKTIKEITAKYGTFFTGLYGNYSVHQSYKDKDIIFTNSTKNNDNFIRIASEEYTNKQRKAIENKIKRQQEILIDEDDQEFIEMVNSKIRELRKQLSSL